MAVTGLGTPNQMRAFIKNGTVKTFQLWDPGQLGYLAAYAAAIWLRGQYNYGQGRRFDRSGEVILWPPTTFDYSNVDNFNF